MVVLVLIQSYICLLCDKKYKVKKKKKMVEEEEATAKDDEKYKEPEVQKIEHSKNIFLYNMHKYMPLFVHIHSRVRECVHILHEVSISS